MNSPAHPNTQDSIDMRSVRPAHGHTNLIACQYGSEIVHYLIMSDMQLADVLSEEGPQLRIFQMLKSARTDLDLPDFSRFDYVIQFGKRQVAGE